ncbi:hypothetical protein HU749_006730 [Pseudomonas ogarae]|uniref:hypothetical protein n=1 Tax=Pseudomonas ogarae (strain DSM 112162 / CECT 30235 / F113) TaxID=1114970 RepID=UPI001644D49F|nr:hypothetical protein [Pseudomonas zarinae]QXH96076.1 hypothetical protein HU749_006730 [Pseudomonas zarinae]
MSLPDIKEWHVETLRLTVFSIEPISGVGREWWKQVTKFDPETAVNRPSAGEYFESGEFLGGQFELKTAFNRVDWSLSFPFTDLPGAPKPEEIHALTFKWLMAFKSWLTSLDFGVARVAVGAVFIKKISSIAVGNSLISDYLHFVNVNDGCEIEDLMIQVNSPSSFKSVEGLRHNRIIKLGVLERQVITIGPAGFPNAASDTVLRCELDMSSPLGHQHAILASDSYELFSEMVHAYLSILKDGMIDE